MCKNNCEIFFFSFFFKEILYYLKKLASSSWTFRLESIEFRHRWRRASSVCNSHTIKCNRAWFSFSLYTVHTRLAPSLSNSQFECWKIVSIIQSPITMGNIERFCRPLNDLYIINNNCYYFNLAAADCNWKLVWRRCFIIVIWLVGPIRRLQGGLLCMWRH